MTIDQANELLKPGGMRLTPCAMPSGATVETYVLQPLRRDFAREAVEKFVSQEDAIGHLIGDIGSGNFIGTTADIQRCRNAVRFIAASAIRECLRSIEAACAEERDAAGRVVGRDITLIIAQHMPEEAK